MKDAIAKNWKLIAGGLVITFAASLMLREVFDYLAGVTRILTMIVSTAVVAYLVIKVWSVMSKKPKPAVDVDRDPQKAREQEKNQNL